MRKLKVGHVADNEIEIHSVADPGCLSRFPDPNFFIPDPGSKRFSDPGSGCATASKNLGLLFIPDPDLDFFYPSRIRNTGNTIS